MERKMEYQGVPIRALAYLIDNAILFALFALFHFLVFGTWLRHIPNVATIATDPICLSLLAVYFIYFIVLEGTVGATVGKLICKIRVKEINGNACGIYGASVRNILRTIDGLVFYLVGIILIAISDKKQRLGDKIAKTVVLRSD